MTEWEENARLLAKFACPFQKRGGVKVPASISSPCDEGVILDVFPLACSVQNSPATLPLYTVLLELDNASQPLHIFQENKLRDLSTANNQPYISANDIIQSAVSRRPVALAKIALGILVRLHESGEGLGAARKINILFVKRLFEKHQVVDKLVRDYTRAVLQKETRQDKDALQYELERRERIAQKIALSACPFQVGDELLIPCSVYADLRIIITEIRPSSFRDAKNQFLYELKFRVKNNASIPSISSLNTNLKPFVLNLELLEMANNKTGIRMNDLYTI